MRSERVTRRRIRGAPIGLDAALRFGALHLELAELAHHVPSALVVQTVDVEHPSQVVGLVLEDPRQEPLGPEVERSAVEVGASEPDPQGADGRVIRTGDRQAPSSNVSSSSRSDSSGFATKPA